MSQKHLTSYMNAPFGNLQIMMKKKINTFFVISAICFFRNISPFCGFYHIPKNPERAEKSAFSSSMTLNFFLPFFRFKYFTLKTLKMSAVLENVKCIEKKELFWLRFHSKFRIKALIYLSIEEFINDFFCVLNW